MDLSTNINNLNFVLLLLLLLMKHMLKRDEVCVQKLLAILHAIRYMCLIHLSILVGHLYLSGILLGVTPRIDTKKKATCVQKRLDYMLKI